MFFAIVAKEIIEKTVCHKITNKNRKNNKSNKNKYRKNRKYNKDFSC